MAARCAIRPQVRLLVGVSPYFLRCGFSEGGDGGYHCKDALVLAFFLPRDIRRMDAQPCLRTVCGERGLRGTVPRVM